MHFQFLTENKNWHKVGKTFRVFTIVFQFGSIENVTKIQNTDLFSLLPSTFEETMKRQKIIFSQEEMSMPISYTVKFRDGRGTENTVYLFWPEVNKLTGLKCDLYIQAS